MDGSAVPTTTNYIDKAVDAWLAAAKRRTGAKTTEVSYRRAITAFRKYLQERGKDLDLAQWGNREDEAAWDRVLAEFEAEVVQFASFYTYDYNQETSNATFALRISILRSFYKFALRKRHFPRYLNPMMDIDRPVVPATYSNVQAIDPRVIAEAMQKIDRTTLQGMRDYALLLCFLETASRKSAMQSLCWRDVSLFGRLEDIQRPEDVRLILNFPRVKGGGTKRFELSHLASKALLTWLAHIYQINPLYLEGSRPLWVNLRNIGFVKELEQLSNNGITLICKTRLGTTHVHRLRHTVAQQCMEAGMALTDIKELLGHANLATLTVYLQALSPPGVNSKIEALHQVFGIK